MFSKIYQALSEELIQQRILLELSQEELGNLIGKSEGTIRNYEKNYYHGATPGNYYKNSDRSRELSQNKTSGSKRLILEKLIKVSKLVS